MKDNHLRELQCEVMLTNGNPLDCSFQYRKMTDGTVKIERISAFDCDISEYVPKEELERATDMIYKDLEKPSSLYGIEHPVRISFAA